MNVPINDLLISVPSCALQCEMIRRKIVTAESQIRALEFALLHMRKKQAARKHELARQLARQLAQSSTNQP